MRRPVIGLNLNFGQQGPYQQFNVRDTYIDAIANHGGLPLPIPSTPDAEMLQQYLDKIDGLILIGGKDYPSSMYGEEPDPELDPADPRRSDSDLILAQLALKTSLPILGICAGAQLLNIVLGGKLIQHLPETKEHVNENYHTIDILGGQWLPRIFGKPQIIVNSNHHQAVDPNHVGHGLQIVARHENVVEAVELEGERFVLGVQWHPERITDVEHRQRLFEFLVNKAAE